MKQAFKKSQLKAGRWVRIRYDDVGCRDALLVDIERDSYGRAQYRIFEPGMPNGPERIEYDQIVAIGPFANVPVF